MAAQRVIGLNLHTSKLIYVLFRKYSIFRRLQKLGPYLTCITLLFKYCIGQPRHNVKYDFEYLFDFHVFHPSWGLVLIKHVQSVLCIGVFIHVKAFEVYEILRVLLKA